MALSVVVFVLSAAVVVLWSDFSAWKRAGTGGTTANLKGYFKIRRWGLYLLFKRQNLLDVSVLPDDGPAYLSPSHVPQREGKRPKFTHWTLPQRQKPEPIAPEARSDLLGLPAYFASTPPYSDYLTTAPSKTEGGKGPAIYVNSDIPTINPGASKIFYEVAHVHPSENSLHVYTSPRDARLIVERGWGRRFPIEWLAPPTWIMVYSPRDEEEVKVVKRIVRAACCFAVGKHLGGDEV